MSQMTGALVTAIKGIGTSGGDDHAFVECQFHDGRVHGIIFKPEMAGAICAAFLQAAGHLEMKQAMRTGTPTESVPVDVAEAEILIGKAAGKRNILVLSLATKSGAKISFEIPANVASKIERELPRVRKMLGKS